MTHQEPLSDIPNPGRFGKEICLAPFSLQINLIIQALAANFKHSHNTRRSNCKKKKLSKPLLALLAVHLTASRSSSLASFISRCILLHWFLLSVFDPSKVLQDGEKISTGVDSPIPWFFRIGLTARSSKVCGSKNVQKYSLHLFHRWLE
jgi:hypothetical protein